MVSLLLLSLLQTRIRHHCTHCTDRHTHRYIHILTMLEQVRSMHRCFLVPGPPNLTLSLQLRHSPQSSLRQPGQLPQPRARLCRCLQNCLLTFYCSIGRSFQVHLPLPAGLAVHTRLRTLLFGSTCNRYRYGAQYYARTSQCSVVW